MTPLIPVVVSGVTTVFYGSDLIIPLFFFFFFYEAYWDEKVQERPCRRLQSRSSFFIMETPEAEHVNDTTY